MKKTKKVLKLEHENQLMREFIQKLADLLLFSHRTEANEILKEVSKTNILGELKTLEDLKRKLDSKHDDSISAVLDYVYKSADFDEYNKIHEILFKYKSKIKYYE